MLLRIGSIVLNLAAVALIKVVSDDKVDVVFNDSHINHGHVERPTQTFTGDDAKAFIAWLGTEAEDVTKPRQILAAVQVESPTLPILKDIQKGINIIARAITDEPDPDAATVALSGYVALGAGQSITRTVTITGLDAVAANVPQPGDALPVQQQRTPAVGDTVTYVIASDGVIRNECPATVTTVWGPNCVNLKLQPADGPQLDAVAALPQADEPTSVTYDNFTRATRSWHWPEVKAAADTGASAA